MNILICGDYCPIGRVGQAIESKRYDDVFGQVKEYVQDADFSIVNLECPICLGEYAPINKCGPNLRSLSDNAVEALSYVSFNAVTLANNHILDYGSNGLCDTISTCKEYSIDTIGAGRNIAEAGKI